MKFGGEEEQHKGDAELPARRGTARMHHALFAQGDIIFRNSGREEVRDLITEEMICSLELCLQKFPAIADAGRGGREGNMGCTCASGAVNVQREILSNCSSYF